MERADAVAGAGRSAVDDPRRAVARGLVEAANDVDVNRSPRGDLSSATEEALIDLEKWRGGDYAALIEQAVLDLRAKVADPARPVVVTVHLGDDLEALAVPGSWDAPRLWFTDQRVHVELRCVGDDPTEKEVAAVERLATAVNEAVELFRKAYRASGGR